MQLRLWNFEFHLQFPCGSPSIELSDFRQSARSGNKREYKQTFKLQSVQNGAARISAGLKKRDHITDTLRELRWLPVQERIVFKINLITFKTSNGAGLRYLEDTLKFYHRSRALRSSRDHFTP